MAHKNLIDGTSYDTKGGRCLVDGTGYDIKKGRTLVDGTGYDIGFIFSIPVEITGSGNVNYCYAAINEVRYSAAESGIEVMPGDVITFKVYGSFTFKGSVTIDDTLVLQIASISATSGTYNWVVPDGITDISITLKFSGTSSNPRYGAITVTTS